MVKQPFSTRPAYIQSIRGLLRLHAMAEAGDDESPDAQAIRDSLERPWHDLSDVERARITGLSEDLYAISEPASDPLPMNPQVQRKLLEALEDRDAGNWDHALELLRRWGKHLDPAVLLFLRGTVWESAGDSETATPFLERATHLDPDNDRFQYHHLVALRKAQPDAALGHARRIVSEPERFKPHMVGLAANILVTSTRDLPSGDARTELHRLIHVLEPILDNLRGSQSETRSQHRPTEVGLTMLLGFCHELIGDHRTALGYYSHGLSIDPGNETLLIARGTLRYGVDSLATNDFERAIAYGTTRVWPYFFVAHRLLSSNRFDECRRMCDRALSLPGPTEIQANLNEWLAISEAELGFPPELVRTAFEAALRLAPDVERIRQNLDEFERSLTEKHPRGLPWVKLPDSAIQAFGRDGRLLSALLASAA